MYTLGAIFIAIPSMFFCLFLFGIAGAYLGVGIYKTTGILWLPLIINACMTGCSAYAAMYFPLKVVPKASVQSIRRIVLALMLFQIGYSCFQASTNSTLDNFAICGFILSSIATVVACNFCNAHVLEDREDE